MFTEQSSTQLKGESAQVSIADDGYAPRGRAHAGILFSLKKEQSFNPGFSVDEPGERHAKGRESQKEKHCVLSLT